MDEKYDGRNLGETFTQQYETAPNYPDSPEELGYEDMEGIPLTLGEKIDALFVLRDQKSQLSEELKQIQGQIDELEVSVIEAMDEAGVEKTSTDLGSVTRASDIYPSILDFGSFFEFCHENNRQDFLQKRVNSAPFKEYFELNGEYPPGLDGYLKDKLNVRRKR